ncbi:phosphoglycolate phosphatase-like HAD superfamily hydrolase [Rhodanobacter sp. A1T4]|nr:phosphoglycolate phosphatase-like HAD superfamily hydrolase [Rhodanobacter sp. A1T4]
MLCLFDLDGTLIDSEHGIVACVKHALAKLDVPAPPQEELREWIGPPLRTSFAPLLDHDPMRIEAAVEHYHERFHPDGWREYDIYPGIELLIQRLLTAGHRLAHQQAAAARRADHRASAVRRCVSTHVWPASEQRAQRKGLDDRRRAGRL